MSAPTAVAHARTVIHRSPGNRHGPITRLISPGDLGELLKPFVFLDLFESDRFVGRGFAPHPHSGIATLTTFLAGSMTYADTTGKSGMLHGGAVEWMHAGRGVWHAGEFFQGQEVRGYQLWLALPPELELTPAHSQYLEPNRIKSVGPARVLLGTYDGVKSPIEFAVPVSYLHVRLQHGEEWSFQPGTGHDVTWLALNAGKLHTSGVLLERELAVFEPGHEAIEFVAEGTVEFVIGSAPQHRYPLVTGNYSVHTSRDTLSDGERTISELGRSPAVTRLRES